jgi:hypothetical protein
MSKNLALLLSLSFFAPIAFAHKDTNFPILPDGMLQNLPKEYGKARIVVGAWQKVDEQSSKVKLVIGKKQVELPPCIATHVLESSKDRIQARGSWYHNSFTLPPYLVIELPNKSSPQNSYFDGYSLMFNLKSAKLIEIKKMTALDGGTGVKEQNIKISELCTKDEVRQIAPSDTKD